MKKLINLLMCTALLLTMATGCREKKNTVQEPTTVIKPTIAATTEQEETVQSATSPMESTQPSETGGDNLSDEATTPVETEPSVTENPPKTDASTSPTKPPIITTGTILPDQEL